MGFIMAVFYYSSTLLDRHGLEALDLRGSCLILS